MIHHAKRLHLLVRAAAILALAACAHANEPLPEGLERVRSVEGITEYRLDNGLQVLLFPDPSVDTITVNVTYRVGSRHESYGETGLAHLLEHMLFKGSPRHPDIPKEMTDRGAQSNGTSSFDRTNYFETFPASEENLAWALDLEADRMLHSFLREDDLQSEMPVVRNEFQAAETQPFQVLIQRVASAAYLWHSYGRPTIGAEADVQNVSIESLRNFYRHYYQPDNATLLLAGKFEPSKALERVAQSFGPLPKPDRALRQPQTAEPPQDGARSVTLQRVGDNQLHAAAYHIPSGTHPDAAALQLATLMLGDTPSGRLHQQLVEEIGLAVGVAAIPQLLKDPGLIYFIAVAPKNADAEQLRTQLLAGLEAPPSKALTENDLQRAKRKALKNLELGLSNSTQIGIQLSEWIALGDWRLLFLNRDRLEAVTLADVQRVIADYLRPQNRTYGAFLPSEAPVAVAIPEAPPLADLLDGYQGRAPIAQGEAFEPTPEHIEQRVTRFTLEQTNVALLPKETRGDAVNLSLFLHYGDEASLMGQGTVARLTAGMILRGNRHYSRQQIQDRFDALKTSGNLGGNMDTSWADYATTREHLPELLDFLYQLYRYPSFPKKEFRQLKKEVVAELEQGRNNPQAAAMRTMELHFSRDRFPAGHPYYPLTLDERIAAVNAVTLDQIKAFHQKFYGGSHADIAIVGDFDPAPIRSLVADTFASWESQTPFQRVSAPYHPVPAARKTKNIPGQPAAIFVARHAMELNDEHPDRAAIVLADYLIGGGFLHSRLATRLRQQEGLSYGAGSLLNLPKLTDQAYFTAYAICDPNNIDQVQDAVIEELEKVHSEGFTQEELAAAKQGYLETRKQSLSENGKLVSRLRGDLEVQRSMQWERAFISQVQDLGLDALNATVRRHLDPKQFTLVQAGSL